MRSPRALDELQNVGTDQWDQLDEVFRDGSMDDEFQRAWSNGLAFLGSAAGLRGRRPVLIEWKGFHRTPGYDLVPADLRIDHVYLISCKYLSRILMNVAPAYLFDRNLVDRRGPVPDWYREVAPVSYQRLYADVRAALAPIDLPTDLADLERPHRLTLKERLSGRWPEEVYETYIRFCTEVAEASAVRWRAGLTEPQAKEEMLWRLLRFSGAPYFVLGTSPAGVLRLRIYTPWDWRQDYSLKDFHVWGDGSAGQPVVRWAASVHRRADGTDLTVEGHVEIRWSHGRFKGKPEAKVYLDTPHHEVPGYAALEPEPADPAMRQLDLAL